MKSQSTIQTVPALDASVTRRLKAVAVRLRGYVWLEGVARLLVFLFATCGAGFLLDYGSHGLRWSMRAALLGMIVVGALRVIWTRVIGPLRVPVGAAEIANLVERRFPHLSSGLISAVRFSSGDFGSPAANSAELMASVVNRAGSSVRAVDFSTVLNPRRARWSLLVVALCVGAGLAAGLRMPDTTRLWFARNVLLQEIGWPKQTTLIVELQDGELVGARGDDLVIQAYAHGVEPREVELFYETASGERGRETMTTVGSAGAHRYRYTFKKAQEDFRFRLEGGDDVTATYTARLLERPRVVRAEIRVSPPSYARLESFTLADDQRAGQTLPGSEVTFSIQTNKPVASVALMAGTQWIGDAVGEADRYAITITPHETRTYHFALVDGFDLANRDPVRFALRMMKDEPPRVRLKLGAAGEMITPQAVLAMELEFADTYGLASAQLVYRVTRDDTREGLIELPTFEPHTTSFTTSVSWPVARQGVEPGERLMLVATAADFDDVSGPNVANSPELTFRVVTPDELLAELARREQEIRMDFERLIDTQEQLRGDLLTLLGRAAAAEDSEEFVAHAGALERRQRNIASSVNVVRQQIEQLLAELRTNQLATEAVEERLGEEISVPLTDLTKRGLPEAVASIRRWSLGSESESADRIDPQQVALLLQMREILANMIQWEGYQEAITMLRDILRLQNELRTEAKNALEEQAGDVFED